MSVVSIVTAALVLTGSLVAAPVPQEFATCEVSANQDALYEEAQPIHHDEDPPWVDCLDRDHPQICSFCCWDWSDDCQADCDETDAACWRRCLNQERRCSDACYDF